MAFGGDTLTTTDVAIVKGLLSLGDASLVSGLDGDRPERISDEIHKRVEEAVDQLKTSASPIPVVLVGGGSVLINRPLKGASEVVRIDQAPVANAIGAAIAQVGGRVRQIIDFGEAGGREAALEKAGEEARQHAIAAGALAGSLKVVEIEEYPMTHMQSEAVDVRIRVVGDLDLSRF